MSFHLFYMYTNLPCAGTFYFPQLVSLGFSEQMAMPPPIMEIDKL